MKALSSTSLASRLITTLIEEPICLAVTPTDQVSHQRGSAQLQLISQQTVREAFPHTAFREQSSDGLSLPPPRQAKDEISEHGNGVRTRPALLGSAPFIE